MHGGFESVLDQGRIRPEAAAAAVPQILRSRGRLDLSFRRRGASTVIDRSYQSGCMRARLPRPESTDEPPCAVLINTAGGVADGDDLAIDLAWGADTIATVTSQAAEKVYRALSAGCRIATRIDVARGARAEWLPQETILFDRCRLARDARVVLADDVTFLGVEAIVLGRTAMGEAVREGVLRDRMRIWRNGRLIYADALALDGAIERLMAGAAIGGGARAMAVVVHASADAARHLDPVREALADAAGLAAASCWNGLLAVRLLAPDGESLRHDVALALSVLRDGRPVPRVWRC